MNQATARKSDVRQDSSWKTCLACDAVYAGEVCGKCVADANGWSKTRTRQATPERWASALDRALHGGVEILTTRDGARFATSTSQLDMLYRVTPETCECAAALAGDPVCCHRAALRDILGILPVVTIRIDELLPARIQFANQTSDRVSILVDGETFGFATTNEFGGWFVFRGSFPTATRFRSADGCTLAEVERQLMAQLPVELPAQPVASAADLAAVA